ncbi:DUF6233 domain-containing protein [Streptomyces flaveolus]|uniref:DUF6233 domain-containing protein n=1 Tax=Streptomyces flaveolus TaxID=67297 RepID=UPI003D9E700A
MGGCWNAAKRSKGIPRAEALRALAGGVKACGACRPDSELGYLEGQPLPHADFLGLRAVFFTAFLAGAFFAARLLGISCTSASPPSVRAAFALAIDSFSAAIKSTRWPDSSAGSEAGAGSRCSRLASISLAIASVYVSRNSSPSRSSRVMVSISAMARSISASETSLGGGVSDEGSRISSGQRIACSTITSSLILSRPRRSRPDQA